ncbi:hypothetical protein POV27_13790 [Aureisphaera galaxeae]|uniref:PID-CTERM protein-sorting domain-containing protein n=1 Tax=Aureisphaera galaxeae TaxID=1538023 RepID=UPI00235016E6|nr:hypothetical protein [Aureisphaera galaxeae]MDC8005128.1 hypothetical protein [Aureisphaera galaxeae]
MRPQIVTIATLVLFLVNSTLMLGQSTGKEAGPPPPAQRTPGELPIDSGLYILLIAGIIYGVYVLLQRRKAKNILD